jgi:hypothetical protein
MSLEPKLKKLPPGSFLFVKKEPHQQGADKWTIERSGRSVICLEFLALADAGEEFPLALEQVAGGRVEITAAEAALRPNGLSLLKKLTPFRRIEEVLHRRIPLPSPVEDKRHEDDEEGKDASENPRPIGRSNETGARTHANEDEADSGTGEDMIPGLPEVVDTIDRTKDLPLHIDLLQKEWGQPIFYTSSRQPLARFIDIRAIL